MTATSPITPSPHHPITPVTPVLIVGAGPTGLTLAIELARRGVPFRLIDRDPAPAQTSRALGVQARTIEVFRLMGIPETALQPAVRPRAVRFAERNRTLARIALTVNTRSDGTESPLIVVNQSDTERVLARRLDQLGGRIEQSVELVGFRLDGDQVVATLRDAAGESEVRTRFLVGADGAHSTVRHAAGIPFVGSAYPEQFLLADLDIDWALPHDEANVWIGDDGLVFAFPLPDERRYRLILPVPDAGAARDDASEAEIAAEAETILRQRTGIQMRRVGDPLWASAFRVSRRQADRYREGPVFLVGDAAHVHSPVGGQGMNTGIQDAFNLGWKLALAVRERAAPGLLDTYQEERLPIARGVLRGTDVTTRVFLANNAIASAFREQVIPIVARLTQLASVRRRIFAATSQLDVIYPDSPLAVDAEDAGERGGWWRRFRADGLKPGDRVPDAILQQAVTGDSVSLFALFARGWTLLLLPGESATPETVAPLERLAAQARATVGDAVQAYLVLNAPLKNASIVPALLDPSRVVARTFGADQGLVALVRPDDYLGYRGRPGQQGELASYLARVFAMQMPGVENGDAGTGGRA
ncbi:MAG: FAD-dependent monooxygenase [Thermomicrobiales bacterium]